MRRERPRSTVGWREGERRKRSGMGRYDATRGWAGRGSKVLSKRRRGVCRPLFDVLRFNRWARRAGWERV